MTKKEISNETKIDFINSFLKNHTLKEKEFTHFLVYIKNNENLLKKMHFVFNARPYEHSLILLCDKEEGNPVLYRHNGSIYLNNGDIFKKVYDPANGDLHIQLVFEGAIFSEEYEKVNVEEISCVSISDDELEKINTFIDLQELCFQRDFLESELDRSLDIKDESLFKETSSSLKQIRKQIEHFKTLH